MNEGQQITAVHQYRHDQKRLQSSLVRHVLKLYNYVLFRYWNWSRSLWSRSSWIWTTSMLDRDLWHFIVCVLEVCGSWKFRSRIIHICRLWIWRWSTSAGIFAVKICRQSTSADLLTFCSSLLLVVSFTHLMDRATGARHTAMRTNTELHCSCWLAP